ncbi:MAG: CsgG/HfaB family protein [Gammaproteobacteria bacterium]
MVNQRITLRFVLALLLTVVAVGVRPALAQSPRLVITDLKIATSLDAQEKNLLRQVNLTQVLREGLTDSRSFRVGVRENESVQAILRERQIQGSPLARDGKNDKLGLDTAEYFLEPTLQAFSVRTRFEKAELLSGMYSRTDSATMQLVVRVFDAGGNTVFEETSNGSAAFPRSEASDEDKARAAPPDAAPIVRAARLMARQVIDALIARINPITVVDVQSTVFIIDRGRNNGFDRSTRFMVYGPPRMKTIGDTGNTIRVAGEQVGEAELSELFEDTASLKLTKGDPHKLAEGCIVRVKEK